MPFLTPDNPTRSISVYVPVPDTIMPLFTGALLELWNYHHWELYGALSVEDSLELSGEMISGIQEDPSEVPGSPNVYRQFIYNRMEMDIAFFTVDGVELIILIDLS